MIVCQEYAGDIVPIPIISMIAPEAGSQPKNRVACWTSSYLFYRRFPLASSSKLFFTDGDGNFLAADFVW